MDTVGIVEGPSKVASVANVDTVGIVEPPQIVVGSSPVPNVKAVGTVTMVSNVGIVSSVATVIGPPVSRVKAVGISVKSVSNVNSVGMPVISVSNVTNVVNVKDVSRVRIVGSSVMSVSNVKIVGSVNSVSNVKIVVGAVSSVSNVSSVNIVKRVSTVSIVSGVTSVQSVLVVSIVSSVNGVRSVTIVLVVSVVSIVSMVSIVSIVSMVSMVSIVSISGGGRKPGGPIIIPGSPSIITSGNSGGMYCFLRHGLGWRFASRNAGRQCIGNSGQSDQFSESIRSYRHYLRGFLVLFNDNHLARSYLSFLGKLFGYVPNHHGSPDHGNRRVVLVDDRDHIVRGSIGGDNLDEGCWSDGGE